MQLARLASRFAAPFVALVLIAVAPAQASQVEIKDFGFYDMSVDGSVPAPDASDRIWATVISRVTPSPCIAGSRAPVAGVVTAGRPAMVVGPLMSLAQGEVMGGAGIAGGRPRVAPAAGPLVLMPISTSPACPRASTWREKTRS